MGSTGIAAFMTFVNRTRMTANSLFLPPRHQDTKISFLMLLCFGGELKMTLPEPKRHQMGFQIEDKKKRIKGNDKAP